MGVTTAMAPESLASIARRLAGTAASCADRLETRSGERTGLHLMETDEYDVWLLRWPPGTRVTPHDHGESAVAFAVVSGRLREDRWDHTGRASRVLAAGDVASLGAGLVHDVAADGVVALSVHVYSPPLRVMSYYDDLGETVVDRSVVDDGPTEAAGTRVLLPVG